MLLGLWGRRVTDHLPGTDAANAEQTEIYGIFVELATASVGVPENFGQSEQVLRSEAGSWFRIAKL
jgi:hypothetical protein